MADATIAKPAFRTRLAPSPTGALHLGNARTFLINWALARQNAWEIVFRVEDLDGPRVKPESAEQIQATLEWLGIDWDRGPLVQSADLTPYVSAMEALAGAGRGYPTAMTRAEADEALSAPQAGGVDAASGRVVGGESRFPAELRPSGWNEPRRFEAAGEGDFAWRFATPDCDVAFDDLLAGAQLINPARTIGDFVIWTKRGVPAYQLAVVMDDARQGVTHVVRGDDLLDSAARQLLLYEALGLGSGPAWLHLPLVLGPDGKRLAKRHGDTRVDTYRGLGVPVERLIGLIGWWCGILPGRGLLSAVDFRQAFALERLSRKPITFTHEDDQWLRHG